LPEAEREQALREALAAAREIEGKWSRAEALAGLAPHLPEALLREALAGLAPHLAALFRSGLYLLWQEMLPLLARRTRRDLLADLRALSPVVAALGGAEAVEETFLAIQDVGRWWP